MVTTNDFSYGLALRPRITLKTIDGVDTLYTFDGFLTNNDIVVTNAIMDNNIGEAGTFSVNIDDSNNELGKDHIHNVKAYLELGKTQASYEHFLIGFGDVTRIDRPATNYQQYNISGFGTAVQATRLLIHRREKYKRTESDAKIYNIVDNALTKRKWRPFKEHDISIQDITGWSRDGISTKVNTTLTVIDDAFVYFSDFLNKLCAISGAVWFIDISGGNEVFTLTYNTDLHTGVSIKSGDLKTVSDNADTTAYIKKAWSIEDNSSSEAGEATRLITTNVIDKQEVFHQAADNGRTNTTFKAIAQQVQIDNDARRIESIELTVDKLGEPDSPKGRLNGDIVLDVGNKPTGTILDEFHIDLGQIESSKKDIEVEVDIDPDKLDVAQAKFWVRIFQRSNEEDINGDPDGNGNPNQGTSHTVRWYHNNIFNTTQPYYSATAPEGDADKKSSLAWNVTNQGPLYTVNVYSNIRRSLGRTNSHAKRTVGLREVFIDTSFLEDPQDIMRFLSLNLSHTSKPKRSIGEFNVTVPNNFLFRPYQIVSFNDALSQTFQDLQIQRVGYSIGQQGDDPDVGTLYARLTLGGSYNTLLENCSCI